MGNLDNDVDIEESRASICVPVFPCTLRGGRGRQLEG